MKPKTIIPSLLVFGPQSELPSQNVLADLRQELVNNPRLSGLHDAVKTLPKFWETLIVRNFKLGCMMNQDIVLREGITLSLSQ